MKYLNMGKVIFGTLFYILNIIEYVKYDWGKFYPKILTPIIKKKNVTHSNSSLKVWKHRKYAIESVPVKIDKENLIFLIIKTVKDIKNHLLKLSKKVLLK